MANFTIKPKPIVMLILDGMGVAAPGPGNAITLANTPNLDFIWENFPHTHLHASGEYVGLKEGVEGNSEVGHITIGAGKPIHQELLRIDNSIESGNFYQNSVLLKALDHAEKFDGVLHLIGLVGSGKLHSSLDHLVALLKLCKKQDFNGNRIHIHVITDGRDAVKKEAEKYLNLLDGEITRLGIGNIVTLVGRDYAMDKEKKWELTKKTYELYTENKGEKFSSWKKALKKNYQKKLNDNNIEPSLILNYDDNFSPIQKNDSIIFFNFRDDRIEQLARMFADQNFDKVNRKIIENLYIASFTDFQENLDIAIAFPKERVELSLSQILFENNLSQLKLAETEKFEHITRNLSGRNNIVLPGESHIEINFEELRKADLYIDIEKEFSNLVIKKIEENIHDFIAINYSQIDTFAHLGDLDQTVFEIEKADLFVAQVIKSVLNKNGAVIITSDHGNAECFFDEYGELHTRHTTSVVPFMIAKKGLKPRKLKVGTLADIAPTILGLMGIEKPVVMTGRNLL